MLVSIFPRCASRQAHTGMPQLVLIPAPVTSRILCDPARMSAIS